MLYEKLTKERFASLYQRIRTVLVPSIWAEPWGYVVVEALYQGRLLIASDMGGLPEMVEGCPGAFLFLQPPR